MRRVHLNTIFKLQKAIKNAIVQRIGTLLTRNSQVRPCHITNKERITRQHQPGIIAATRIRNRQRNMLRPMPRRE